MRVLDAFLRFSPLAPRRNVQGATTKVARSADREHRIAKHRGFLDLDHAKRGPMGKRRDKLLNQSWQLNR